MQSAGRGVVRALCWVGGGKWAGRVATDTCSLLGGGEGGGTCADGGGKWAPRVARDTCSLLGGGEGPGVGGGGVH